MPGGRRGLVAPQNTFLDNLIKRASALPDTCFLLANAQIVDYPIVYCSEEFSKLLGYPRSEVMQRPVRCDFMVGTLTDKDTLSSLSATLSSLSSGAFEVLYYKKNGHAIWLQVDVTAIKNEQGIVVLFLCTFRDITAFKEPLEGGNVMMSNLSKFAKLAWTMTRSRNLNATGGGGRAAAAANNGNSFGLLGARNGAAASPSTSAVQPAPNAKTTTTLELPKPAFLESLPEYKHDPPKTPPHILLHYSTFKVVWDWVILGLTFYTVVMVPYNLAINRTFSNENLTLLVVDSIVDVIFFIDIIFNFHTSFVGSDGSVIVEETKIRQNYLRSGFIIDVMACLPYDALNFFDTSSSPGYGNIFSILKVMRLFRLGRVARALHRFLESSFALLLLMLSFYTIVAHWFACIWYVIGREDLKNGVQHGWLSTLANNTDKPFLLVVDERNHTMITGGPPTKSMYLTALYFTMTCMTSIGFGNVAAETDMEKTFCCCMMIISSLLYAAIFGHVTTIIHNMTLATAKYHEMLNSVKEFMLLNQVPKTLCERVLDYVVSKWANTKGVDQNKVLSVCPKDMRADICVHLNRRVFNGCPAFRLASDGCLRALAVNFDMLHSAPGDFIFRKGESIRELCFVVSGSLEVIQDGEILAFLSKGDVFGDSAWREHKLAKSAVHVRALTYCDIHMINVEKLKEVLEFYKAFAQTFARNLTLTYDLSRRTVFYKVADKKLEKVLSEVSQFEQPFTPAQILLLKKAVNKFKGQISDGLSSTSENVKSAASPSALRDKLIHRLSSAKSISQVGNLMEVAGTKSSGGRMAAVTAGPATPGAAAAGPRAIELQGGAEKKPGNASSQRTGNQEQKQHTWKFMRQKSQQMLNVLSPPSQAKQQGQSERDSSHVESLKSEQRSQSRVEAAYAVGSEPIPEHADDADVVSSSASHHATSSALVATNILHDFNLSMSEYRGEIRDNIQQLDQKINRLETAIVSLSDRLASSSHHHHRHHHHHKRSGAGGASGAATGAGGDQQQSKGAPK